MKKLLAIFCLLIAPTLVVSQTSPSFYDFARPTLDWYTIETEHFKIHFHMDKNGEGSNRTARVVAKIAEDVYPSITALYEHEPDTKVDFVLKDFEDYSNGAAYFFDNKIEIWAPALESPLRGDHDWLRNVITHEFTHIIQVQKTMKTSRKLPVFYFQYLGYEETRRPDVLYGYPNIIASYPIATLNNPAWFAEGTAQYQRNALKYDDWDTHRDMLLRTQVLDNIAFSLPMMGTFLSKTSLERESVYNHGFAFTRYLAQRFGESVLRKISASLGEWENWNMEEALEKATGISGTKLHQEWMHELGTAYTTNTSSIRENLLVGKTIDEDGFSNFYPKYSPNGQKIAFVSNKGEDYNLSSLYIYDVNNDMSQVIDIEGIVSSTSYECSLGHKILSGVAGAFDWHPNGEQLVYAKTKDTPEGYLFSDLYLLDLHTKKSEQLTKGERASYPIYNEEANEIAYIKQQDGTTNIWILDVDTKQKRALTNFTDGTQITDLFWSKEWIYFSKSELGNRDIYRIHVPSKTIEPIIATEADERNPFIKDDTIYFSSDETGIFNIYRKSTNNDRLEQLTNVIGGAFMPNVSDTGSLVYADYQSTGYKISLFDVIQVLSEEKQSFYSYPNVLHKLPIKQETISTLNEADDRGISAFKVSSLAEPDSVRSYSRYKDQYTKFSFYPVIRLDNYSRPSRAIDEGIAQRTGVSSLARNAKVGFYASSREVLEGISFFGGITIAPASSKFDNIRDFLAPSRWQRLERDIQLIFDYKKGLSFIPKRWSPQLSLEIYNVQRSVENGLSIEEFPCTACYPVTNYTDLTYTLWEANIIARSKINKSLLAELGYRISPYEVRTEPFFSNELKQTVGASSQEYFRGRTTFGSVTFEKIRPTKQTNVLPEGIKAHLNYEYSPSRLLDKFDIEEGVLIPRYNRYKNHRLALKVQLGKQVGFVHDAPHGVEVKLHASTLLGGEKDDFFNDYVGGLIGARGYPFYALGGNKTALLQFSYHFPIVARFDRQLLFITPDKLYGRIFADGAMAWTGDFPGLSNLRKDIGAELRLGVGSFYLFPTALFLSGTYGIDQFDFQLTDGFQTPEGNTSVTYGKEFRFHFGLLFDFGL